MTYIAVLAHLAKLHNFFSHCMKFDKDSGYEVEEYKLGVVYVGHHQQ